MSKLHFNWCKFLTNVIDGGRIWSSRASWKILYFGNIPGQGMVPLYQRWNQRSTNWHRVLDWWAKLVTIHGNSEKMNWISSESTNKRSPTRTLLCPQLLKSTKLNVKSEASTNPFMYIFPMFERKNSRLLEWPFFIKGRMEHVCFKLRFRIACKENIYSKYCLFTIYFISFIYF